MDGDADDVERMSLVEPPHPGVAPNTAPAARGSKLWKLLANPTFLCYLAATVAMCWVRDGLLTHLLSFLATSRGVDELGSDVATLVGGAVTLGGCVGGVLCGLVSDRVFAGRRAPPIMVFSSLQLLGLASLWRCHDTSSDLVLVLVLFALTTCVLGNYTMLSYTIPADLPPADVGLAAGVMTAGGYLASGLATWTLGFLIESRGYFAWWASLVAGTILSGLFVLCGTCFRVAVTPVQPVLSSVGIHVEFMAAHLEATLLTTSESQAAASWPDRKSVV